MKLLRILFFALLLLVIAIVAIVLTTPLISLERFKPRLTAVLAQQTGLDVEIAGPLTLQLIPKLGLVAADLTLQDPANLRNRVSAESLDIAANWQGVLQRELDVTAVVVKDVAISLDVARPPELGGTTSAASTSASLSSGTSSETGNSSDAPVSVSLKSLAVENAAVTLFAADGTETLLSIERLSARHTGGDQLVISGEGGMASSALSAALDVTVQPLPSLLALPTGAINVDANLRSSLGVVSFLGDVDPGNLDEQGGSLSLRSLDLDGLKAAIAPLLGGQTLPEAMQGQLSGDAQIMRRGDQVDLERASLTLDHPQARVAFNGTATLSPITTAVLGDVKFSAPSFVGAARAFSPATVLPPVLLANDGAANGSARLTIIDEQITADAVDLTVGGPGYQVAVGGNGGYEFSTPVAFLTVSGRVDDLRVLDSLAEDSNLRGLLDQGGSANLAGEVTLIGMQIDIQRLTSSVSTPSLSASYEGSISQNPLGVSGNGLVDLTVANVGQSARQFMPTSTALHALDGQLTARTNARFGSEGVELDGLDASIRGSNLEGRYRGSALVQGETIVARGGVEAATGSLRALLAPLGVALPAADPSSFGAASIRGEFAFENNQIALTQAKAALDQSTADLNLKYRLSGQSGARSGLNGEINVDRLDLDRYLGTGRKTPNQGQAAGVQRDKRPLESGWGTEPIDLSALRALDANVLLRADRLRLAQTDWGRIGLKTVMQAGRAQLDFEPAQVFGGTTGGTIVADASQGVPRFATDLTLDSVTAQQFLSYLFRIDRLGGIANGQVRLTGTGLTEAEIMRSLSGAIDLDLSEGAVLGIDLDDTLRNVRNGILTPVRGDTASTPFTKSDIRLNVNQGVGTVENLRLFAPVLQLNGAGAISFADRTLNLSLPVSLGTFSSTGQAQTETVAIPLLLLGSWFDPTVRIDGQRLLADALQNPQKFLDLLPDGLGADDLLRDAQQVQDQAKQQLDQIRDRATDRAREVANQALDQAREQVTQAANQAAEQVTSEITNQIGQVVPEQFQGLANQVIGTGQIQQQTGAFIDQLGGQLNGQVLEQQLNQGLGQVLQQPQVQQQLQQGVQDAGQQLLRGLFGN